MQPRRTSSLRPADTILFFPTCANLLPNATPPTWSIPIHGIIYRPGELSRLRRAAFHLLKRLAHFRFPRADFSTPLFQQRLQAFLADNERNNRLQIEIAGTIAPLKKSRANGHFHGTVLLPAHPTDTKTPRWLPFRALLPPDDLRIIEGQSQLLPPTGLSVISDIDDTLKITEVQERRLMLRNTFLREFQCVPEIAALYRQWAAAGAAFHYVSASPWHLYPFLAEFFDAQHFPPGSFHLRTFRLMPRDLPETLRSSARHKAAHARQLLARFPNRRFILVGDSGESDPAMYAALARQFPSQIIRILIRNVTGQCSTDPRWKKTFATLPPNLAQVFNHPHELPQTPG